MLTVLPSAPVAPSRTFTASKVSVKTSTVLAASRTLAVISAALPLPYATFPSVVVKV